MAWGSAKTCDLLGIIQLGDIGTHEGAYLSVYLPHDGRTGELIARKSNQTASQTCSHAVEAW